MADSKFKSMMNTLSSDSNELRELSKEENKKLKSCLIDMYQDICCVCNKYNFTVMLGGGSALGSIRHQGFIPWDDDLDIMMPRDHYEKFKSVFQQELGKQYILSAPNYQGKAKARFPKIIKKGTIFKELTDIDSDLPCGIFLDIFIIENVPENLLHQKMKGLWCSALMFGGTQAFWFEHRSDVLKVYMSQTNAAKRAYNMKMAVGKVCSIIPSWKWFNAVDKAVRYSGKTSLVGMPTGRKHYFGEILPREIMLPVSYGWFCGLEVSLPSDVDAYLKNLYGNYMEIPPKNKREKHFIVEFQID